MWTLPVKIPTPSGQPVAPGTGLYPLETVPGCVPCLALRGVDPRQSPPGSCVPGFCQREQDNVYRV